MIAVSELVEKLKRSGLLLEATGYENKFVNRVTNDSRKVGPGDLFIAIRGEVVDGHLFIDKAVNNGAIAIVHEAASDEILLHSSDAASVHVSNGRLAEAVIAAAINGEPATELHMVGITGTNGKTSTAYLTRNVLSSAGVPCGMIGTVESSTGKRIYPASQTTPGPLELHDLFRQMVEDDCAACAMEVSSHAIVQDRIKEVPFNVAAFTNLSQDHLDYHHTFDEYLAAKKRLFDDLDVYAVAVINGDDKKAQDIVTDTAARVVSYGTGEDCDIRFSIVEQSFEGLELEIDGQRGSFNLVGGFNAYNIACAYSIAIASGVAPHAALEGLQLSSRIPGRFEPLRTTDNRIVVIDYSHTPDALKKALQTIAAANKHAGEVWCIFGCGGNRDKGKRPLMGHIAERLADHVIVTSDNPREEDPYAIMRDIVNGLENPEAVQKIVDRREAVCYAGEHSKPGDIILIAGKGHETYQIVGTQRLDCDDPEIARQCFPILTATE